MKLEMPRGWAVACVPVEVSAFGEPQVRSVRSTLPRPTRPSASSGSDAGSGAALTVLTVTPESRLRSISNQSTIAHAAAICFDMGSPAIHP